jgi:hypothetical protein
VPLAALKIKSTRAAWYSGCCVLACPSARVATRSGSRPAPEQGRNKDAITPFQAQSAQGGAATPGFAVAIGPAASLQISDFAPGVAPLRGTPSPTLVFVTALAPPAQEVARTVALMPSLRVDASTVRVQSLPIAHPSAVAASGDAPPKVGIEASEPASFSVDLLNGGSAAWNPVVTAGGEIGPGDRPQAVVSASVAMPAGIALILCSGWGEARGASSRRPRWWSRLATATRRSG